MSPDHLLTRDVTASRVVVSPHRISVLPVNGMLSMGRWWG